MNKLIVLSILNLLLLTTYTFPDEIYEGNKNIKIGFGVGIALRNDLKIENDYLIGSSAPYSLNVEFYVPIVFKSSSRFEPEFRITYFNSNSSNVQIKSTMLRLGIGVFPFIIKYNKLLFEPGFRMGYNITVQTVIDKSDNYVIIPNQNIYNPYIGLAASTEIFILKNVSIATELQIPVTFIKSNDFIIATEGTLGLRVYL